MAFTQDFRTQKRNYNDGETRIGEKDRLWYDSNTNTIRISDGVTPGGNIVGGSGGGGDYTLPTASTTVKGGVKVDGTTITITNQVISATQQDLSSYATQTYVTSQGYLTAYTETDPVFLAHAANNVTNTKISNWDTAYGWGNHASAGYLTSVGTISYNDLSNKPTLFSGSYTDLTNKPTLFDGAYASLTGKPTLFSGSYTDLTNKPTIPTTVTVNGTAITLGSSGTVTAAAGTLTGSTLASGVTTSSLTSVGTLTGLTVNSTSSTPVSITADGRPGSDTNTWSFVSNQSVGGPRAWIQFPDSTLQTTAWTGSVSYDDLTDLPTIPADTGDLTNGAGFITTADLSGYATESFVTGQGYLTSVTDITGNAGTVTNGVYTTDTSTVTNTMLAGSIANNKLTNSSITVNGTSIALGASGTVTADANTLTGTTLASGVTASSLTSVGTLTGVTSNAATAFTAGDAAISGVALQIPREGAIRNLYNGANSMYFDVSIGGSTQGSFQFRSSSSYTNVLTMSPTGVTFNTGAPIAGQTPSVARLAWNSLIDTELTVDNYRFRVSNSGGIFPQIISNTGGTTDTAWTGVGAISGSAVTQVGSTGTLVPNNAWTTLYSAQGMNNPGDTVTVTLQDKSAGRIYRVTFMRSNSAIVGIIGYNIIAERLL